MEKKEKKREQVPMVTVPINAVRPEVLQELERQREETVDILGAVANIPRNLANWRRILWNSDAIDARRVSEPGPGSHLPLIGPLRRAPLTAVQRAAAAQYNSARERGSLSLPKGRLFGGPGIADPKIRQQLMQVEEKYQEQLAAAEAQQKARG